jgi:hypothetical protein
VPSTCSGVHGGFQLSGGTRGREGEPGFVIERFYRNIQRIFSDESLQFSGNFKNYGKNYKNSLANIQRAVVYLFKLGSEMGRNPFNTWSEAMETDDRQDDASNSQQTKTGVDVEVLDAAMKDARKITKSEGQISYLKELFGRLKHFGNRDETADLRIVKVLGQIWKLEVRGYVLGEICVGICFAHIENLARIVVLGIIPVEPGEPLKGYHVIKMKQRLAHYLKEVTK